jgi:endonuclease I
MHQIFVVEKSANGSRGNAVFGILENVIPERKVGGLSYKHNGVDHTLFVPHVNVGAVCRSTLYTLVTYEDTFHQRYFPKKYLEWIVETAVNEPVTLWEKHRNQELYRLQKNRNPFIDRPALARMIDFDKCYTNVQPN